MPLVARTTGAITSGLAALTLDTSVERSCVFSGKAIVSTMAKGGLSASTAA